MRQPMERTLVAAAVVCAALITILAPVPAAVASGADESSSGSAPASALAAQSLEPRFAVGEVFPDIALPSLADGAPMRLSDFRGRKVMLHVFASW